LQISEVCVLCPHCFPHLIVCSDYCMIVWPHELASYMIYCLLVFACVIIIVRHRPASHCSQLAPRLIKLRLDECCQNVFISGRIWSKSSLWLNSEEHMHFGIWFFFGKVLQPDALPDASTSCSPCRALEEHGGSVVKPVTAWHVCRFEMCRCSGCLCGFSQVCLGWLCEVFLSSLFGLCNYVIVSFSSPVWYYYHRASSGIAAAVAVWVRHRYIFLQNDLYIVAPLLCTYVIRFASCALYPMCCTFISFFTFLLGGYSKLIKQVLQL